MKRAHRSTIWTDDMSADIAIIGLAVMGENLILNMASKGLPCSSDLSILNTIL